MRFSELFISDNFPIIDMIPEQPIADWQITFYSNSALSELILTNLWWMISSFVLLVLILIFLIKHHKKVQKPITMAQESIDSIIQKLGGITNIKAASIEGARLSFKVHNSKACDLIAIKASGALGIFVSGQTIKMMFPYDAQALIDTINQMLKGE